jgi:hypothetical protein
MGAIVSDEQHERYVRAEVERYAKRSTKAKLIEYIVRELLDRDEKIERLTKSERAWRANGEAARLRVERLEHIERAIGAVLQARTGEAAPNPQQLSLLLGDEACGDPDLDDIEAGASSSDPGAVLLTILDHCEEITGEDEGLNPYELAEALSRAVEDRNLLLGTLGFTDAEWSAIGGACENDLKVQS